MIAKLIIGIGNPDEQYKNTRHNVGFMFLDFLAKNPPAGGGIAGFSAKGGPASGWEFNKNLNSLISRGKLGKNSVVLAKPQTYVNKSGESARKLAAYYKLRAINLIVVHDDLDIPFGNIKISFDKNSGGHKGVESIMRTLKTKKFYRLRIGIATTGLKKARQQTDKKRNEFVVKMVLSKFTPSEQEQIKKIFKEGYEKLAASLLISAN